MTTAIKYDVAIKPVEAIRVAGVAAVIPSIAQVKPMFGQMFGTLEAWVTRNGGAAGPPLAIYHDSGTGEQMRNMHVEAAVPFAGTATGDAEVRVHDLPPVETMVWTLHRGPVASIPQAYQAVMGWIQAHGYTIAGPCREIYLIWEEGGNGPGCVTEVQFPVTK